MRYIPQPSKVQTKSCQGNNGTLQQLSGPLDFLVEKQFHENGNNRPIIEWDATGWHTIDKY
jgi:hypothetical protein